MNKYAIVVAGGKGLRMGADIPKQFLPLAGKPVLMHTLEAFYRYDSEMKIILVLPVSQQAFWKKLCLDHGFDVPHRIANGGESRYDSVKNGLALTEGEALVAIHDGVRPFLNTGLIARCFAKAAEKGSAIPVFELTESLRRIEGKVSFSEPRDAYRSVQTPQTFRLDILKKAYELPNCDRFTDDASIVEAAGFPIDLVEGLRENIKITTPLDLLLAEQIFKLKS
jgi:2-C-methyl-D-erythritol 4-phosphate cytidylyltransferase